MPEADTKLHIGDPAPDFTLSDVDGTAYRLSVALAGGPMLLVFFRGTWCSSCRTQTQKLTRNYPVYQAQGVQLIGIAHQRADLVREYLRREPLNFPYLLDEQQQVSRDYGVLRTIDAQEWQPIVSGGWVDRLGIDPELLAAHGPRVAYPAIFLIAASGNIGWLYVSSDPYDWPSDAEVAAQIANLANLA